MLDRLLQSGVRIEFQATVTASPTAVLLLDHSKKECHSRNLGNRIVAKPGTKVPAEKCEECDADETADAITGADELRRSDARDPGPLTQPVVT